MSTDQTPAQRMAEIEAYLAAGGPTCLLRNRDARFLFDRCRKLEAWLEAVVAAWDEQDPQSLLAGGRALLGDRNDD